MITLFYRRVPAETVTANGEVKLGFALIERSWLMKFRRFYNENNSIRAWN